MKTSQTLRIAACAFFVLASPAHALDPLSYSRYDQVKTSAMHIDLKADFERKRLGGYAELTLDWLDKSAKTLVLDTHSLSISKIQALGANGKWTPVAYKLGAFDKEKGSALQIDLPEHPSKVRIYYTTSPTAPALQWLTPKQTLSGKRPFMFSQNQPINARSWVPSQDTPAVRFPYSAHIDAPAGLRVVMSAENDPKATGKGGWNFKMPQPVASYMMAIGIGELQGQELGKRTAVYAEPLRMKAAAYELGDTEKMIDAAESLYGPYRWGRYDMLVLPPSFPIGGMENPRMTFLTPTMIAGDRSLVDLVAHELAHSWSGNLVTNATWKHWWLNEGVTTYVTTRILEKLYGEDHANMNLKLEQEEALASLAEIPVAKQALLTKDPDTSNEHYTDEGLAYPKGAWFLRTLEMRAGRAKFDKFLRSWFDNHAFQSVTNDQFLDYLRKNLLAQNPEVMSEAELQEWMYGPGIPANAPRAKSKALEELDATVAGWLKGDIATAALPVKHWSATEWMKFMNDIDNKASAARLKELDKAYSLSTTQNNEIAFRFYRAAIHAGYTDAIREPLRKFLMSVGRQKFVVPLYTALVKDPKERDFAVGLFAKARERYHPETQASVAKVMPKK